MKIAITGTTSGLGQAMATYCRDNLNKEVFTYSTPTYDLATYFGREAMFNDLNEKAKGELDVLINNAGRMILDEVKAHGDDLANMVQVNLLAVYSLSMTLYPLLRKKKGQIINIASVAGITGDAECPLYSATKAGVIAITKSFAKAYAPDVRVNCISPGFFNTNLVEGPAPQELIDEVPLKREADPIEIIPALVSLLNCRYMTGANIVIDGGLSL